MICAVWATNAQAQECRVIGEEQVLVNGKEYAIISHERLSKITLGLRTKELLEEENALLKQNNEVLKNNMKIMTAQVKFYEKQLSLFTSKLEISASQNNMYPVVGAFILGNLTSGLAYGFWSSRTR